MAAGVEIASSLPVGAVVSGILLKKRFRVTLRDKASEFVLTSPLKNTKPIGQMLTGRSRRDSDILRGLSVRRMGGCDQQQKVKSKENWFEVIHNGHTGAPVTWMRQHD